MKNKILRKLHNQTGASLSLALLVFLACLTVSGIIIGAASASMGREAQYREQQQSSLISAGMVNLINTEIQGLEIDYREEDPENEITGIFESTAFSSDAFSQIIVTGINNILIGNSLYSSTYLAEMEIGENSVNVSGSISIASDYTVTMTIEKIETETARTKIPEGAYKVNMVIRPTYAEVDDEGILTIRYSSVEMQPISQY